MVCYWKVKSELTNKKQPGNCYSDLTSLNCWRLCERKNSSWAFLFWILKRKEDKVNKIISFETCRLRQHVQRRRRGHGLHGHHRHHDYQRSRATAALGLLRHLHSVRFCLYYYMLNLTNNCVLKKVLQEEWCFGSFKIPMQESNSSSYDRPTTISRTHSVRLDCWKWKFFVC